VLILLALPVAIHADALLRGPVAHAPEGEIALSSRGGALLIEAVGDLVLGASARSLLLTALLSIGAHIVLAPLLTMALLEGLRAPVSVLEATRAGVRHYRRALLVSLLLAPLLALVVGCGGIGLLLVSLPLRDVADPRVAHVTLALLALPIVPLLAAWQLARAAIAVGTAGVLPAIRVAAGAMKLGAITAYLFWYVAGAICVTVAQIAAHLLDGAGVANALAVLAAGQLLVFGRTLARARWLADALGRVEPRPPASN
jgi:hypothetical protein